MDKYWSLRGRKIEANLMYLSQEIAFIRLYWDKIAMST